MDKESRYMKQPKTRDVLPTCSAPVGGINTNLRMAEDMSSRDNRWVMAPVASGMASGARSLKG